MELKIRTMGDSTPAAQAKAALAWAEQIVNLSDAMDIAEVLFDRTHLICTTDAGGESMTELFYWNPTTNDWDIATGTIDTFPAWATP